MRRIFGVLLAATFAAACSSDTGSGSTGTTEYTLTAQKGGAGGGTVTATGISCGSDCTEKFASGTTVTLTATADSGSIFASWAGCDTTSGATCTVAMNADRTVTATFNTLTVNTISDDILVATTWTPAVYRVTQPIDVKAPLTILPGTTVQFDAKAWLNVTSTLTADGQTAATPVTFTSSSASPAGGEWGGIRLAANGSTLNHCAILYAGADDKAALLIADGFSASVTNCTFAHHKTTTDSIGAAAALDASGAASATVIRDNLFFDDRVPLAVNTTFSPGANTFDNSAAAPNNAQPSKYNGVVVTGCGHVTGNITWPALAVPYVIGDPTSACNYLVVDAAGHLNLNGTGVKFFENGNITVNGLLTAANATFTSIRDDAHGGDTNGDGAGTAQGGDWRGISLARNGSSIDASRFLFGGGDDTPAVTIRDGISATVTNTEFGYNAGPTATIRAAPALDASDAAAGSVLHHNKFYGNTVPLAMNTTLSIDDTNVFSVAGVPDNAFQAIVVRGCGHVATAITWSATKVPLVIGNPVDACNYLNVDSGGHLTIADGVIVKFFESGRMWVDGLLTANAANAIVFTAWADDANGGDTNHDGAGTTPQGGAWNGISLRASGSELNKVQLLYGGGAAAGEEVPAVYVDDGKRASITNCVFAHNRTTPESLWSAPALDLSVAASNSTATGNRFFDNSTPMAIHGMLSLDDSNEFDSGQPGALLPNTYNAVNVVGCTHVGGATEWLVTKVPLVVGNPVDACNYMVIGASGHLTLGSGVVMKFWNDQGRVTVDPGGALTVGDSNRLTSVHDDEGSNDSDGDGSVDQPVAGEVRWLGVKYYHAGGDPTCDQGAYMHYNAPNDLDGSCSW